MPKRSAPCPAPPRSTCAARLVTIVLLSGVLSAVVAAGATELKWDVLQKQGRVVIGTVLPPETGGAFYILRITGGGAGEPTQTVLTLDKPAINRPRYALTGQVRYEGIEGIGYLEMWSHFPDGGQYFSRTLGEAGPMMKLQGTSGWRAFTLPFDATGAPSPTKLVFNVVLPGRGVVYLGSLQLEDVNPGARRLSGSDGASARGRDAPPMRAIEMRRMRAQEFR